MKSEFKTITPEMAKKILAYNEGNRNINYKHVNLLASEMKSNRWKPNGEAIKMSKTKLIDGQHRLTACVTSGLAFETLFVTDLDEDVFITLDTGKKRTAADSLQIEGVKNANILAAAAKQIRLFELGKMKLRQALSTGEIRETIDKNPILLEMCNEFRPGQMKGLISSSTLLAFGYLFSQSDKEVATEFMTSLCNGLNLDEGSPIDTFRAFLFRNATAKNKAKPICVTVYLIKSFNAFYKGRVMKGLRWSSDQPFPKIATGLNL